MSGQGPPQGRESARRRAAIVVGASKIASRERLFLATADLLAERGWQADILTARPIPALRDAVRAPVELIDIGYFGPFRLPKLLPHLARLYASTPALARYLKSARPDVLMGTSIPPNMMALGAARMAGTGAPVVIRQSNVVPVASDPASAHIRRRPRDRLMPKLYPEAAAVIAVSGGVAENLRLSGWIAPERIHWIPNGVELAAIAEKAQAPTPHRWLEETDGPPVIVAVGRLIPKKDYPTLFAAFAKLTAERPARLIVLGEGRERGRLTALIRKLGLGDSIDLAGHQTNPFAYLARASLFVLSSEFEGMPSVVIEALACGCPAVSTDCPSGPAEILGDGDYGRLTPIGDADALATAMAASLAAPRDADRLKARAAEFSLQRAAERYADLLTRAADRAPAPAG